MLDDREVGIGAVRAGDVQEMVELAEVVVEFRQHAVAPEGGCVSRQIIRALIRGKVGRPCPRDVASFQQARETEGSLQGVLEVVVTSIDGKVSSKQEDEAAAQKSQQPEGRDRGCARQAAAGKLVRKVIVVPDVERTAVHDAEDGYPAKIQ